VVIACASEEKVSIGIGGAASGRKRDFDAEVG
jgi:hypothetical protein